MIETLIMMGSLIIMGYAFYISSRMFWSFRGKEGYWKWIYMMVTFFILATYFLFAVVLVSFVAAIAYGIYFFSSVNLLLGVFLAGVLTRRGSNLGNILAMTTSIGVLLAIRRWIFPDLNWQFFVIIGTLWTFGVAVLFKSPSHAASENATEGA